MIIVVWTVFSRGRIWDWRPTYIRLALIYIPAPDKSLQTLVYEFSYMVQPTTVVARSATKGFTHTKY